MAKPKNIQLEEDTIFPLEKIKKGKRTVDYKEKKRKINKPWRVRTKSALQ